MKGLEFTPLLQAEALQFALVEAEQATLDAVLTPQAMNTEAFSELTFANALAKTGRLFTSERRFDSTANVLAFATFVLSSQRPRVYAQAAGFISPPPTSPSNEENWSLPVSKEIVRPPQHSEHVNPLREGGNETNYVNRELTAWLSRARTSTQTDIGDLWYLLDQLARHGKKQDSLWVWLLDQLLWGELELSSNQKIAQVLIQNFIVWFRDMVREEEDRVRILAASLKGPFYQKGYTRLVSLWERLRFLMKPLLDNLELASLVLSEAVAISLGDPKFDYQDRLGVLEDCIRKAGFDENGKPPISLFLVWVFALTEAWQKCQVEAIVRLEEIFEYKGWGKEEEREEAHRQARHIAIIVALKELESSPPNGEPLKNLMVMVHTTPLRKYEQEFLELFQSLAEVRPKNLTNFVAFLIALRREVNTIHFFLADYETYQTIVRNKLRSHLEETLPRIMTERGTALIEMKNHLLEADDRLIQASLLGVYMLRTYLQMAQEVVQEQMPNLVKDIFTRGIPLTEKRRLWDLLKQNYRTLMDEDQTLQLNKTLKVVIAEMINEAWEYTPRTELRDFLSQLKETTEILLEGVWVVPPIDPWTSNGHLKDRHLYLKAGYLEATFRAVLVFERQDPFLRLLRRELEEEIRFFPQSTQENILRSLYRSLTSFSLKRIVKEVAAGFNVSLP